MILKYYADELIAKPPIKEAQKIKKINKILNPKNNSYYEITILWLFINNFSYLINIYFMKIQIIFFIC